MSARFVRLGAVLALCLTVVFAASGGTKPDLRREMTATEFGRCGLEKLTATELRTLEEWLAKRLDVAPMARQLSGGGKPENQADALVAFNTSTHKYHCPSCLHARQCTRNCIEIPRAEARARGGIACKVCRGACPPSEP